VPRAERPFRTHERSEERTLPVHRRVVDQIDIRELIRKLWRQKYVIIATTVVITVLAALVIWNITPRFTASAFVMIEPRESQVVNIEAVLSGLPADAENIESQIQVIRSRKLAAKTIEKLQLDRDPEFNASLQPPSVLSQLLNWRSYLAYLPDGVRETLFSPATEETKVVLSEEEEAERLLARLIDGFLGKLKVTPEGRSRVIRITFESQRARTAAEVANTLADFYIVAQLDAKFEATRRANEWLSERIADLSTQVDASEKASEAFRSSQGLTQGGGTTLAEQEVSQLNTQLVGERARRAEAEARLRQVQSLVASDGVSSASDVMNAPMIQNLRQQETEIERRMAELSQEFGERHPTMVNVRAELADIRGKLQIEVNRIVQSLRNEVAVARAREATLDQALTERKRAMGEIKSSEVQLRALEREAQANRTLLETFLTRSKETHSQQSFQQADASILSPAAVPNGPSYPNKKMMVAVALLIAGGIGVILAFLIEQLDQGFRSTEQVEQMLGLNPLGLLPSLPVSAKVRYKPQQYILNRPRSAYAEAVRSLHTSLLLSDTERPPKVIMIASSLPREGKTSTALSLAIMQAKVGQNVVIVDCDLRRPSIHKALGLRSRPGLVEVLAGEVTLDEALMIDSVSGATVLATGAPAADPPDLLASQQMRKLLSDLAERFDLVIIDSAPTLAVSDTRILSRLVDKTVFVVRWAKTRRETAIGGLKQILDVGGDVAGVLLSMVDVKEHARYGFSDSGYYTGEIRKYYTG
jgi:exopolysaccharide transport family protein